MSPDFLPSLLSNIWSIFLVVLFFGGSIFVHELGHFLAARRRGVKVERFSIGFGPALWKKRGQDGCEYRIAAIPLGGYVLLPQLADLGPIEGEAVTDVATLPPISYPTKIIVLVAGAAFNVLFAFGLACLLWIVGQPVLQENQTTKVGFVRKTVKLPDGQSVEGPAYRANIRPGDNILSVDGASVKNLSDIDQLVALGSGRTDTGEPSVTIELERNGQTLKVNVLPILVGPEKIRDIGVDPAAKVTILRMSPGSAAEVGGLQLDDIITHLDGQPVGYLNFISDYLRTGGEKPVRVTFLRKNIVGETTVTPRKVIDPQTNLAAYRMGIEVGGDYTKTTIHVAPWTQIWDKVVWTKRTLVSLLSPASNIGLSKLNTPIGIAYQVDRLARADLRLVLWFSIMVNINLAIMNLLPIPVLDGGHIVFASIARLRGRQLPFELIAKIQAVFMILLFSMFLYVGFHDVVRIGRDMKENNRAKESAVEQKNAAEQPAPVKP